MNPPTDEGGEGEGEEALVGRPQTSGNNLESCNIEAAMQIAIWVLTPTRILMKSNGVR
jgi:hypothetical protein